MCWLTEFLGGPWNIRERAAQPDSQGSRPELSELNWFTDCALRGGRSAQECSEAPHPSLSTRICAQAEASSPPPPAPQRKLQEQKQHVVAEFERGHQFLREREQHLLDQLARLEQELTEGREKYRTRGTGELARLALVISELEGKAQQPAAELMQVRGIPWRGPGHQDGGPALPRTRMKHWAVALLCPLRLSIK